MNIPGMRRISTSSIALAMVGVALLLAGQPLFTGFHHFHEAHHWCPEHQTLEHSDLERHGFHPSNALPADAVGVGDSGDGASAHAVCGCQRLLSERFRAGESGPALALCFPAIEAGGLRSVVVGRGQIPCLILAPKNSPPLPA